MTKSNQSVKTVADIRLGETNPTAEEQARVDAHDAASIDAQVVTAESITACISAAIGAAGAAFHELEQRVRGTNGKLYPMGALMPGDVAFNQETGEEYVETVNRFAYLQRQITSVLPWKIETMLDAADERIADQRKRILQATRQLENGRTDASMIERMADFLETLIEQRAMLQVALDAALDAYEAAIGEQYETKAMRADRERKVRNSSAAPKTSLDARLARLGVTR